MIFLDANFFVRAPTRSSDPRIQRMNDIAADLLRAAERADVDVTTSAVVIAEVAFILRSRAHYELTVPDAAGRIAILVRLRGVKLRDKRIVLRALDLWMANPRFGFVDALAASYVQQPGVEFATFDSHFDHLPGIVRWPHSHDG